MSRITIWIFVLLSVLCVQAQGTSSKVAASLLVITIEDDHPALRTAFGALGLKITRSFSPRHARVACYKKPGRIVESRVYLGSSKQQVLDRFEHGSHQWCGIEHIINKTIHHGRRVDGAGEPDEDDSHSVLFCDASLPVVCRWCVLGVHVMNGRRRLLEGYGLGRMSLLDKKEDHGEEEWKIEILKTPLGESQEYNNTCVVRDVKHVSALKIALWILGACLVSYAHVLSQSTAFRLTGGSMAFMALSGILLLYIVWKNVPQKRVIISSFILFGSALIGCIKVFGMNMSSMLSSPLYSSLLAAYVVGSGLMGAAVTYYFNDESNEKLRTILKVALQILGICTMYMSTTSPEAGVTLICIWMVYHSGVSARLLKHCQGQGLTIRIAGEKIGDDIHNTYESPLQPSGIAARTPRTRDEESPGCSDTPNTPTVFRVSTVALPPTPEDFPDKKNLHELVQRGKILNVETDRSIAIGKGTYNTLFMKGYEVDFEKGTITPPDKKTR